MTIGDVNYAVVVFTEKFSRCLNYGIEIQRLGGKQSKIRLAENLSFRKSQMNQNDRNLEELKRSMKVVSAPGAALQVRTYKMPEAIQKKITKALKEGR